MAKIAKAAGISKALLYHYFPSKEAYFVATLEGEGERAGSSGRSPDPALAAAGAARRPSLDAYLEVDRGELGRYDKMIRYGGGGAGGAGRCSTACAVTPRTASCRRLQPD